MGRTPLRTAAIWTIQSRARIAPVRSAPVPDEARADEVAAFEHLVPKGQTRQVEVRDIRRSWVVLHTEQHDQLLAVPSNERRRILGSTPGLDAALDPEQDCANHRSTDERRPAL